MRTALIVDDSALARLTLKRYLIKFDLEVYEAECAADCRYWLRHNPMPDVIFMDITMPEVDGFQALEEIRSDPYTQHIPVIMYSGDNSEQAKQRAREGKATGFLRKPVNEAHLATLIERLSARLARQEANKTGITQINQITSEPAAMDNVIEHKKAEVQANQFSEENHIRDDFNKMQIDFERDKAALSSMKTMLQRQSNDLAHLQYHLQQCQYKLKYTMLVAAVALGLSVIDLILLFFI